MMWCKQQPVDQYSVDTQDETPALLGGISQLSQKQHSIAEKLRQTCVCITIRADQQKQDHDASIWMIWNTHAWKKRAWHAMNRRFASVHVVRDTR